MIKLLKRLFNLFFFGKKNAAPVITSAPIITPVSVSKPVVNESKPMLKPKKRPVHRMKNNLLHIEHNGSNPKTSSNTYIQSGRIIKAGPGYNGRIDKYRCTSLERAMEMAAHLKGSIERATFKDKTGQEFQIV